MTLLMSHDEARKNPGIHTGLLKLVPELRVEPLYAGDFAALDTPIGLGVERKSFSNLMSSMGTGELDEQMAKMVEVYDFPVLLVEGLPAPNAVGKVTVWGAQTKHNYGWIVGTLAGWYARGILPYFVDKPAATPRVVAALYHYAEKPDHRETFAPKRIVNNLRPMSLAEKIMVQFGGVGPELARQFHGSNPVDLATKTQEEWVALLGPTRGLRVYEMWQTGGSRMKASKPRRKKKA